MEYQSYHQARFDGHVRIAGLPSRGEPRRGLPVSDGLIGDPQREAPSFPKSGVVFLPVLHPELLFRDVTAAFFAVVGWHG